jgi:hypothetical protein
MSFLDAVLLDRRQGVAAAGDGERRATSAIACASALVPFAEGVELEHADRAVPDHGAGLRDQRCA